MVSISKEMWYIPHEQLVSKVIRVYDRHMNRISLILAMEVLGIAKNQMKRRSPGTEPSRHIEAGGVLVTRHMIQHVLRYLVETGRRCSASVLALGMKVWGTTACLVLR
jgi:hypothetical protein